MEITNFTFLMTTISVMHRLMLCQVSPDCEPKTEVVSIFDDNFTDVDYEHSLGPYYIEVARCVTCKKCRNEKDDYPVPNTTNIIKIYASQGTLQYSVYNHTSCKCGKKKDRDEKLFERVKEITKASANRNKNPPKVTSYEKPQPRYFFTKDNFYPRYQLKKQCVLGCPSVAKKRIKKTVVLVDKTTKKVPIDYYDDTECNCLSGSYQINKPFLTDLTPKLKFRKVFFAAFLLALVLILMLGVDFHFCRRKKGFCYTLFSCKKQEKHECSECRGQV